MAIARTHRIFGTRRTRRTLALAVVVAVVAPAVGTGGSDSGAGPFTEQAAAAAGKPVLITAHRRNARRGGHLAISGRVRGAPAAATRRGAVRIFVLRGRRWVLSRRTTADASGAFRSCGRIRVHRRTRIARLRAVTPAGRSRVIRVRVSPRAPRRCEFPRPRSVERVALADNGSSLDPSPIWGKTDCQTASRHKRFAADGVGGGAFRRMTVFDGDDIWGERCELGLNDHRYGPTAIYKEGQRLLTNIAIRLPEGFPLWVNTWQAVLQMKQTQPSANGGGTPVLELDAYGGKWRLRQSLSAGPASDSRELWSAPARTGAWTPMTFDIRYSQHSSQGRVQLSIDLNADGDYADSGERSPRFTTYTLKRETTGGGSDGIAAGESIPSHLRAGIYHNPAVPCASGCSVDLDELRVVRP